MASFREEFYRYDGDAVRDAFSVRVCVVLNRAYRVDGDGNFVVAVKVTQGNDKRFFINIDGIRLSEADFDAMCREQETTRGRLKRYADVGKRINDTFGRVCIMINDMMFEGSFTFDEFKKRWRHYGKVVLADFSPYVLWKQVAESKSAGTESNYKCALKRFTEDMGENMRFRDINKNVVNQWRGKMIKDGLSKTTVNIYLRALRVVLNEAARVMQSSDTRQIFDGLAIGGRNSYNDRKEHYLTVEQWRLLWDFYESEGNGNAVYMSWRPDFQRDRMDALGMMLFMYLADGMNLIDVLNLRYDDYYYQHERRQFHFLRQKVADRTGAKVVFPVLKQMRVILERQGKKEERGGLVFGYLEGKVQFGVYDKENERELRRLTGLYNSNIADRMKYIAKAVGLEVNPTPTWCRHSFASNLIQAGVPREYITASMAHIDKDTTDNYIDRYSYEQMVDYNSRLLADPLSKNKEMLKKLLSGMSKDEILALINENKSKEG